MKPITLLVCGGLCSVDLLQTSAQAELFLLDGCRIYATPIDFLNLSMPCSDNLEALAVTFTDLSRTLPRHAGG